MKIQKLASICALVLDIALWGCGNKSGFTIKGEIEGSPNMNVYLKYYGDDAVHTSVTAATGGEFSVEGRSARPTLVEFLDNEYNVLGWAWIANGEKLDIKLNRSNPYAMEAKGNEVMERFSAFAKENADSLLGASPAGVNSLVEGYIAGNPSDMASALLFITTYRCYVDPVRADSVMRSIDAAVRPDGLFGTYNLVSHRFSSVEAYEPLGEIRYRTRQSDSVLLFDPRAKDATFLVFGDENSHRTDSVLPYLQDINDRFPKGKLQMLEFVFYPDTMVFVRATARDSADWVQAWAPGGVYARGIDRLAIPSMPFYIVADSTGQQVYRGKSADDAVEALKGIIPD